MHAGRDDYIKILNEYNIYTEVKAFDAPHSFVLFEPWFTPMLQTIDAFLKKVFNKTKLQLQKLLLLRRMEAEIIKLYRQH